MSEDNNLTAEQLQAKLAELESTVNQFKTDKEYWEKEAKSAFSKRDEFKKQIEEAERQGLETNKKFEDLYKKEQELTQTLKSDVDAFKPYKEKWETYETSRRSFLLEKVEDADLKKAYEKLDLTDLEIIVGKITAKPPATDGARSGKSTFDYNGKRWDEISS